MPTTLVSTLEVVIENYTKILVERIANRFGIPRSELMDMVKGLNQNLTMPFMPSPQETGPIVSSCPVPVVPKKNVSGYVQFCNARRAQVKSDFPAMTFGEISKELGKIWRELPLDEKEKYNASVVVAPAASQATLANHNTTTLSSSSSPPPLTEMTLTQLKDICTRYNLKKTGSKDAVSKRIVDYLSSSRQVHHPLNNNATAFPETSLLSDNRPDDDEDNNQNPLIFYENDSIPCSDDASTTSSTSFVLDNDDNELAFDYS